MPINITHISTAATTSTTETTTTTITITKATKTNHLCSVETDLDGPWIVKGGKVN